MQVIKEAHRIRGLVNMIRNLVSNNFEIYSVLKPGSSSSQLLEMARQDKMKLNHDDILIPYFSIDNAHPKLFRHSF